MPYLIAEVGQNHNGDVKKFKKLIDLVSTPAKDEYFDLECRPFDAVKTTIRDLDQEMSEDMWNSEYNSPHAYGDTYGKHRMMLELTDEQIIEVSEYAHEKGIDFVLGVCSPGKRLDNLANKLKRLKAFKIPSRDIGNIPLIKAVGEHAEKLGVAVILSTGFVTDNQDSLMAALSILTRFIPHDKIVVMHCVSQYPTEYHNVGIGEILRLRRDLFGCRIGYSDHTIGISTAIGAAALGAEVIEKHVTLDRHDKGGDHYCSLGPDGISRFLRDMRNFEATTLYNEVKYLPEDRLKRVGRSLAYATNLSKGHELTENDFIMASPGGHLKWDDLYKLVGMTLLEDVNKNDTVRLTDAERTYPAREAEGDATE